MFYIIKVNVQPSKSSTRNSTTKILNFISQKVNVEPPKTSTRKSSTKIGPTTHKPAITFGIMLLSIKATPKTIIIKAKNKIPQNEKMKLHRPHNSLYIIKQNLITNCNRNSYYKASTLLKHTTITQTDIHLSLSLSPQKY